MKKYLIRAAVFLLLFALCFSGAQSILHYRWSGNENLYTRNIRYSQAAPDSIDVLCLGTSELYAAYDPIVTYEEAGITGYNFAITFRCAMTAYYQLLYALEYQTPDIVLCDFSCLFDDMKPHEQESIYRKVVECMPDKALKEQMIREICAVDDTQSYLSWKFPLLRYHTMWSELTAENFQPDRQLDDAYPSYQKGSMLYEAVYEGTDEITPDLWNHTEALDTFSEFSVGYYNRIIELCQSKGIEVVAVTPPKIQDAAGFAANRGKLPMPISGAYIITSRYGQYAVEGLRNVKLDNKGIDIQGKPGAQARAIFDGKVAAVFQLNGLFNVLIRHGNYISVYCNLSSASVKAGDTVKTKQSIGQVFSDGTDNGRTVLHFQLRREKEKLNPEPWLNR